MSDVQTVTRLLAQAKHYGLAGVELVEAWPLEQLAADYNGIGPAWFADVIRRAIDRLSPDLQCVAFIHDVEWAHSDGSREAFEASNARFEANGVKVANAKYRWYDLRRYIVRRKARVFADLCQDFGWSSYLAAREPSARSAKATATEEGKA